MTRILSLSAPYFVAGCLLIINARVQPTHVSAHTFNLVHHGLASEARSTAAASWLLSLNFLNSSTPFLK